MSMKYPEKIHFGLEVLTDERDEFGDFVKDEQLSEPFYANITDDGDEKTTQLFGSVVDEIKTIRLQKAFPGVYDFIVYYGERYEVLSEKIVRGGKAVYRVKRAGVGHG